MGGRKKSEKRDVHVPKNLAAALRRDRKASATFEAFSFSKKRDYIEWLSEARTQETRAKRLAAAIEWMSEGKERNWKYARKGNPGSARSRM